MMNEIYQDLKSYQTDRALFSLKRSEIDSHSIQAFVSDSSEALVLLQYVRDFQLDGLLVLNVGDITSLNRSDTDRYQQNMMQEAGVMNSVPDPPRWDLDTWQACLRSVRRTERMVILEEEYERPMGFTIGLIDAITDMGVSMNHFTGAGRWLDDLVFVRFDEMTSLQARTSYVRAYAEHFSRNGHWPGPEEE